MKTSSLCLSHSPTQISVSDFCSATEARASESLKPAVHRAHSGKVASLICITELWSESNKIYICAMYSV